MTRKPRKQSEHLVTGRLLTHAYGQMGEIATAGGFFTYFVIMQVYGFDYSNIFFLLSVPAVVPTNPTTNMTDYNFNANITFNAASPTFGNPYIPTNASNATYSTNFPNWLATTNNLWDLRGCYLKNVNGSYAQAIGFPSNVLGTISNITGFPVAYTVEAVFYAQSGYFVTIVMVQWSNVFACKSRKVNHL